MAWSLVLCVIVLAIAYVFYNYFRIKKMDEGTNDMIEMAGIIRSGANTFMKTEYGTIIPVVVLIALLFELFVCKTSGITFITGACMSSVVCVLGMRSATYANVRTANKARESLSIGETVQVALCGGSISGLAVQAFGLLGLTLILMIQGGVQIGQESSGWLANMVCNPTVMRVTTYSLGCSVVAMFNRVAGGNYTKAADISADILGKIRHDLPEDDSRVPNTVADFIGDNVNDIAGNCSDLLESFVATISASSLIALTLFEDKLAHGMEEAAAAGRSAAKYVAEDEDQAEGKMITLKPAGGVRYTVPSTIRPEHMPDTLTVRFRVGNVYKNCYLSVYFGDERVQHRKKQVMAPGEMEHITLPKVLVERAGENEISISCEEVK